MVDHDKAPETKQPKERQPEEQSSKPADAPVTSDSVPDSDSNPEDTSDFGGLPARNLKKNLGCGG